jgi:hypothetical protein
MSYWMALRSPIPASNPRVTMSMDSWPALISTVSRGCWRESFARICVSSISSATRGALIRKSPVTWPHPQAQRSCGHIVGLLQGGSAQLAIPNPCLRPSAMPSAIAFATISASAGERWSRGFHERAIWRARSRSPHNAIGGGGLIGTFVTPRPECE